jgi:hypothetical protein
VAYCNKRSIDKNVLVVDFEPAFRAAVRTSSLNEGYAFCAISMLSATDNSGCASVGVEGVRANEAIKRKLLLHPPHDLTIALLFLRRWDIFDWL